MRLLAKSSARQGSEDLAQLNSRFHAASTEDSQGHLFLMQKCTFGREIGPTTVSNMGDGIGYLFLVTKTVPHLSAGLTFCTAFLL